MSRHPTLGHPVSRRRFLITAAASSGMLVIAARIDFGHARTAAGTSQSANAFVAFGPDNTVTVTIKNLDMGQGIATGMTTIVADELDADWAQMRCEFAPSDSSRYDNLAFSNILIKIQGTGASSSLASSWEQLRSAGAAARAVLVRSAAAMWNVKTPEITINRGTVIHAHSGRRATFGEVAARPFKSAPLIVATTPKQPKDWIYIGKDVPRIDSDPKTAGAPIYAMDVRRPGMLTAVVARPPRFGSTLKSFDPSLAMKVPGVVAVVGIPGSGSGIDKSAWDRIGPEFALLAQDRFAAISPGVAVLAKDTWSAIKGREVLAPNIVWDESQAELRSSEDILAEYRRLADEPFGFGAVRRGKGDGALSRSRSIIEADFTFPYLAHAPMEPLNAVLETKPDGGVEVWAGSQFQTIDTLMIALALGKSHKQVQLNTVWAGGSFGRRATPNGDYINELAHIVRASGTKVPVHLVWTREDDIKGGRYRPMMLHRVKAGLDSAGKLLAWEHRMVGQSFISGTLLELKIPKPLLAPMAEEGVPNMAYEIPNLAAGWRKTSLAVPTLWWRSVSNSHTAYVVEVMIDALASAGGRDPVEFRIDLLAKHPRHVAVLKLAKDRSGFGEKLPPGRGRGVAVHECFNTVVAMVADVIVESSGSIVVKKVTAAVDCGIAINPDIVRAQIEGSIGFALGAALRNEITLDAGRIMQSNFHDYEPLRISEMPDVEVHIIDYAVDPEDHPPTGVGEPGVPPVAPAVANAIFAATGKRLYSLPWDSTALRSI